MASNFRWNPKQFEVKLNQQIDKNLDQAAIMLTDKIKESFGNSGITGTISGATRGQRASNRSQPWGPANVDTGHLKRSIAWEKPVTNPSVRRVGTGLGNKQSVGYAMWLEFGTRKMLPRPFLRPAIHKYRPQIRRLMTRPVK